MITHEITSLTLNILENTVTYREGLEDDLDDLASFEVVATDEDCFLRVERDSNYRGAKVVIGSAFSPGRKPKNPSINLDYDTLIVFARTLLSAHEKAEKERMTRLSQS